MAEGIRVGARAVRAYRSVAKVARRGPVQVRTQNALRKAVGVRPRTRAARVSVANWVKGREEAQEVAASDGHQHGGPSLGLFTGTR